MLKFLLQYKNGERLYFQIPLLSVCCKKQNKAVWDLVQISPVGAGNLSDLKW